MDGEVASLPNFKQQRKPEMDCFYDYASIMASMEKSQRDQVTYIKPRNMNVIKGRTMANETRRKQQQ